MSRFLTAKVAVAALTALVAVGGVAAATTVARTASKNDDTKVVRSVGKADQDRGPDPTGPARAGLCRAWNAGNGRENGGKEDSTAFQALVDAAGGEDKVPAFCAGTDDSNGEDRNSQGETSSKRGLCRSWAEGGPNQTGNAEQRQRMGSAFDTLAKAAGGEANIPAFCAKLLTSADGKDATSPGRSDSRNSQEAGSDQGGPTSNGSIGPPGATVTTVRDRRGTVPPTTQ